MLDEMTILDTLRRLDGLPLWLAGGVAVDFHVGGGPVRTATSTWSPSRRIARDSWRSSACSGSRSRGIVAGS